jgi:hypothetical protein
MKALHAIIASGFLAIVTASCAPGSADGADKQAVATETGANKARPESPSGLVKSFEFLGCSGDWTDEGNTPDVWRTGNEHATYFLVRHADTCGYTIGSKPAAKIQGGSLELSYELSNTNGMLAACPCEFWAKFELTDTPDKLETISVNGVEARLKGSLAER